MKPTRTNPTLELSFLDEKNATQRADTQTIIFKMGDHLEKKVCFSSRGASLKKSGDALFCFGLRPAIELGVALKITEPVSPELLSRCDQIQALICQWYPGSLPVEVIAAESTAIEPAGIKPEKTAVFYSGGVDSSYSLFQEAGRLDAAITIIGADISGDRTRQAGHLDKISQAVADRFSLNRILVTTDLRQVSDRLIGWVEYHGAVLAGIGHMLSDDLQNVIIASSADEASWNRPWGSHPGLDPLWSTPAMNIEHHGLLNRVAKIEAILENETIMASLRVCDYDDDNCGVCEDCRFMIHSLDVLNAAGRAPTFENKKAETQSLPVTGEGSLSDFTHLREYARKNSNAALDKAITRSLRDYRMKKFLKRLVNTDVLEDRFKRLKRRYRYRKACRAADAHVENS